MIAVMFPWLRLVACVIAAFFTELATPYLASPTMM
jgi:hypothetical protein